jgi:steroid 5-alpha reductase family enzyme
VKLFAQRRTQVLTPHAAIIQNILLFMLGLPTQIAASQPHVPLTTSDIVLGVSAVVVLLVEVPTSPSFCGYSNC